MMIPHQRDAVLGEQLSCGCCQRTFALQDLVELELSKYSSRVFRVCELCAPVLAGCRGRTV